MGRDAQTPSHQGLKAWFELLRTARDGLMPKYQVYEASGTVHCSYRNCTSLTTAVLMPMNWEQRWRDGRGYLFAYRHHKHCPWQQHLGDNAQSSFTTQPLERAYIYWALFEHKLNHK